MNSQSVAFNTTEIALFCFLNINKPRGVTSRWVVDQVKRLMRPAKVGHAGTLDPLARGVLVVAVGPATRLMDYVQQMPKRYRAEFLVGRTSDTEDVEGNVMELVRPPIPGRAELEATALNLVGVIQQRPPAFSALKVAGKRAYALARKGRQVELEPRDITVHRLAVLDYQYPRLTLDIECSSGTYVRSLGRDLAESLGTGAVMSALERTAIGRFRVEDAIDVGSITRDNFSQLLLPPRLAVEHLPAIVLDQSAVERIARGQFIQADLLRGAETFRAPLDGGCEEYASFDERENLVAILTARGDGQLGAMLNFASASS